MYCDIVHDLAFGLLVRTSVLSLLITWATFNLEFTDLHVPWGHFGLQINYVYG